MVMWERALTTRADKEKAAGRCPQVGREVLTGHQWGPIHDPLLRDRAHERRERRVVDDAGVAFDVLELAGRPMRAACPGPFALAGAIATRRIGCMAVMGAE